MNIFRFLGDLAHLVSIFLLIHTIEKNKSANGLSLKTQVLYMIVYITRYTDLFTKFYSVYNTLMKITFLVSQAYIIFLIAKKYIKNTKIEVDTFPIRYLFAAAALFALIFTQKYTVGGIVWSFSLWLESVAIIPQLYILQRTGEAENITTHYIAALGIYRALYIPNWIWRYLVEGKFNYVSVLSGVVQTLVYTDFFYIYWQKVLKGKKFSLPV
ncbi:hypothetical protein DIURU_004765 [Diutina rugosa]|uniref:ER lumen protein-retaining receptor n=1 Tax=Diutina rugosa TaxID=5481 RepID=A0A642UF53_DIURU|nr:uncharacterized protein DIURU_004765 [Diutina rugosa]KAA8897912.1 hypothetical protein DIURU_004765 [Diutina rugosa]